MQSARHLRTDRCWRWASRSRLSRSPALASRWRGNPPPPIHHARVEVLRDGVLDAEEVTTRPDIALGYSRGGPPCPARLPRCERGALPAIFYAGLDRSREFRSLGLRAHRRRRAGAVSPGRSHQPGLRRRRGGRAVLGGAGEGAAGWGCRSGARGGRGRQLRLPRAPAVMGLELAHEAPSSRGGSGVRCRPGRSRRRQRWSAWATAAGVFVLGLAAYAAGRSGLPLCRPHSLWQYHGAGDLLLLLPVMGRPGHGAGLAWFGSNGFELCVATSAWRMCTAHPWSAALMVSSNSRRFSPHRNQAHAAGNDVIRVPCATRRPPDRTPARATPTTLRSSTTN